MSQPGTAAGPHYDPDDDLDEAWQDLRDQYPGLDWEGPVNDAVSQALERGSEIGQDFGNRHPD